MEGENEDQSIKQPELRRNVDRDGTCRGAPHVRLSPLHRVVVAGATGRTNKSLDAARKVCSAGSAAGSRWDS